MRSYVFTVLCSALAATMFFVFILMPVESTANEISVKVNDKHIGFDSPPFIDDNNRTMVPIRFVANELEADVYWNGETKEVSIVLNEKKILLEIDNKTVLVDNEEITIDTEPVIKEERTMVPLRFVTEAFGADVEWDQNTRTVAINLQLIDEEILEHKIATIAASSAVNIRSGPGINYDRIDQVDGGLQFQVVDDGRDRDGEVWYEILLTSDKKGWVAGWLVDLYTGESDYVSESRDRDALVIGSIVNIRSGPGLTYDVVTQVVKGDTLNIMGKLVDWYEIRLPDGSRGWVYEPLVSITSNTASRGPYSRDYNLDSLLEADEDVGYPAIVDIISIEGNEGIEILIQGNEPLASSTFVLQNPWRLVIDIQGVEFAGNFGKKLNNNLVESIRTGNPSDDTSRVVIDLKKPVSYSEEALNSGKVLSFYLHESSLNDKVVVLDPGHGGLRSWGGIDTGAIGPSGVREVDVVMEIARKTADMLTEEGATVVLTRTGNTTLDLDGRAELANNLGADVFVSIHADAYPPSSNANGTAVYYNTSIQRTNTEKLARLVQYYAVKHGGRKDAGIKQANFRVLVKTKMPSILIETAFLTNPEEEKLLNTSAFQEKMARGIARGIGAYFFE